MHLLLALDHGFESLAAVALTSYLLHQRFESVVLVTPAGQRMQVLESVAAAFDVPLVHQPLVVDAPLHQLPAEVRPYFFCIEALNQSNPGRYLYVDADTLCVSGLEALAELRLDSATPLAACSHGRPMPDRSLVLGLETPFHYFNAGVLLFDSESLSRLLTPSAVVEYYLQHQALCRFREQCALNAVMQGHIQFLPGKFNLLSWMRGRQYQNRWQDVAANSMAYCLPDVREHAAIVHLSDGALPLQLPANRHERFDHYWLLLEQGQSQPDLLSKLPCYADLW